MRAIDRWVVRSSRASQVDRSFRPRPGSMMCLDRRSNQSLQDDAILLRLLLRYAKLLKHRHDATYLNPAHPQVEDLLKSLRQGSDPATRTKFSK